MTYDALRQKFRYKWQSITELPLLSYNRDTLSVLLYNVKFGAFFACCYL